MPRYKGHGLLFPKFFCKYLSFFCNHRHIIFGVVGAVGVYEFIQLNFTDYMFGKVQFVFIDTSASAVLTSLHNASVMVLFAYIGYIMQILLNKKWAAVK